MPKPPDCLAHRQPGEIFQLIGAFQREASGSAPSQVFIRQEDAEMWIAERSVPDAWITMPVKMMLSEVGLLHPVGDSVQLALYSDGALRDHALSKLSKDEKRLLGLLPQEEKDHE